MKILLYHLDYDILVIWKVDGVGKQEGRELTRERTKRGRPGVSIRIKSYTIYSLVSFEWGESKGKRKGTAIHPSIDKMMPAISIDKAE